MVLNENYIPINKEMFPSEKIFLGHFAAKSKEEYIARHTQNDGFFKTASQLKADGSFNDEKFKEVDQNEVMDERIWEYYNLNLSKKNNSNELNPTNIAIDALEVLKKDNINMEEYLSAAHILFEYKNLFDDDATIRELLKPAFNKAKENINIYYAEMFFENVPFIIKKNIADIEYLKNTIRIYYDALQCVILQNRSYMNAALLRTNKKWLDIL